jgi:hypothetical protein
MDIFTFAVTLLLIIGALLLVMFPLWQHTISGTRQPANSLTTTLDEFHLRYEVTLASIKELMFDYESGKISDEDYQYLLSQAKLEAAKIRQKIDHLTTGVEAANKFALDAKAELFINQAKREKKNRDGVLLGEIETEIEQIKKMRVPGGSFCSKCGEACQPEDGFCMACGHRLNFAQNSLAKQAM